MTEREMKQRKAAARKARQRKARNRRVLTTVALMLVVCIASIGGTIAWLQDTTTPVVNTFSTSDINIWMTETVNGETKKTTATEGIDNDFFKMVPGTSEPKDPRVVIGAGSEDSWVFLKVTETIEEGHRFNDYIEYEIDANNWSELTGVTPAAGEKIYYCKYSQRDDTDIVIKVLKDEKVSYPTSITKEDMEALQVKPDTSYVPEIPSLSFEAYAVQMATFEDQPLAAYNTLFSSAVPEPDPEG